MPRRWSRCRELSDGQEAPESYHSVQGYSNNALNPAVPFTYEFLEKVFDEMVELFPSAYIHIGGDEVANGSWLASPLARKLMEREGISGTFGLQSYFLKQVKDDADRRGRKLAGWNEVAHGGGVDAAGYAADGLGERRRSASSLPAKAMTS